MDMSDNGGRAYWLWLSHACGQGSACAVELVRHYGDAEAVYAADEESLRSCGVRISKSTMAKLCTKELFEEKDILDWCERCGVQVLVPGDGAYPKSLLSLQLLLSLVFRLFPVNIQDPLYHLSNSHI